MRQFLLPLFNVNLAKTCLAWLAASCICISHMVGANSLNPVNTHPDAQLESSPRPTVGLVLSGGGAKGSAHVGVIRYLEQQQIEVDYIVGTSIGAYVGGLYALGFSANDIETIMLGLDWESGFNDNVPRQSLRYRDKQDVDRYNMPFELGLLDGQLLLPKGLLRGQTMGNLYLDSFGAIENQVSFNDLATPFSAIATDISTGEAVVLNQGNLLKAMQASATVPGILQPTVIDGKSLVDGGIVSNLPVETAKNMGADIVIAIDIGADLSAQEQLNSAIAIVGQLSTLMTRANAVEQIATLSDADILIRPDVSNFDTTDFSALASGFELGQLAASSHQQQLETLASTNEQFRQYLSQRARFKQGIIAFQHAPIEQVRFNNQSSTSTALIKQKLNIDDGESVSTDMLIEAIDRVYALNDFEKVTVEFEQENNQKVLVVNTEEKSWGPNFFDIGFSWQEDFENNSNVILDLAYQINHIADTDTQVRFELTTGKDKLLATEVYLPLDELEQFYAKSRYQYQQQQQTYYEQGLLLLKTTHNAHHLYAALGYSPLDNMVIELGIYGETGDMEGPQYPQLNFDYDAYGSMIHVGYDSLDSYSFPSSGILIEANVFWHKDKLTMTDSTSFNSSQGYESVTEYQFSLKKASSYQHHTLIAKVDLAGVDTEEFSLLHTQNLGGFLNLSGESNNALVGSQLAYGALIYQHRSDWQILNKDVPVYMGLSVEAGNVWQRKSARDTNDLIYAASIFVGTETDFGPAVFGFGVNDLHHQSFYLTLGKRF
ncbi:patatin-like phospholipase family protein [Shewanella sp. MMG014]|uniref:patatin-like phospholipase family protein n=1 Tax=Shewanella sp. MMG014 TaxID=2822691 RepID=UPI001B384248|nr:patatin-like phospholipase family protein [Shewanella sp. MMG014]MBQ4889383.1 patatin-like phospholipase family protein [Shewanella sp. MMG014]